MVAGKIYLNKNSIDELVLSIRKKNRYLKNKNQFVGFNGEKDKPSSILLKNNNLHIRYYN